LETAVTYATERLDHLGIVAGVCREIGLAEFLDEQAKGSRQRVTIGTATVAMVLNGLGFTNRRLYLVPQFFENKPLGRLLGAKDIQAGDLNDDCLGRTLELTNLYMAGDYCRVPVDLTSMEAAISSGLQAAAAIVGQPVDEARASPPECPERLLALAKHALTPVAALAKLATLMED
jgi:Domain of unknown function (DUF4277)